MKAVGQSHFSWLPIGCEDRRLEPLKEKGKIIILIIIILISNIEKR